MTTTLVLAHGIARFDKLTDMVLRVDNDDANDDKHYFKNVRTHLRANGFDVWHTNVDWAGSVTRRASDLERSIETILSRTGAEQVHIIAHSMGGLDARHMLFDNRASGLHRRIASLTTIATPHRGSPMADFVLDPLGFLERSGLESPNRPSETYARLSSSPEYEQLLRLFETTPEALEHTGGAHEGVGMDLSGVRDLTTKAAEAFNEKAFAWESTCGVRFRTYAAAQTLSETFLPLRLSWRIIHGVEGDNDGLVSVDSARFRNEYFQHTLEADHLNELGWWPDVPPGAERREKEAGTLAFYLEVARAL